MSVDIPGHEHKLSAGGEPGSETSGVLSGVTLELVAELLQTEAKRYQLSCFRAFVLSCEHSDRRSSPLERAGRVERHDLQFGSRSKAGQCMCDKYVT